MILMIDNYDSFTYNLVQVFRGLGADMQVVRNDKIDVDGIYYWTVTVDGVENWLYDDYNNKNNKLSLIMFPMIKMIFLQLARQYSKHVIIFQKEKHLNIQVEVERHLLQKD